MNRFLTHEVILKNDSLDFDTRSVYFVSQTAIKKGYPPETMKESFKEYDHTETMRFKEVNIYISCHIHYYVYEESYWVSYLTESFFLFPVVENKFKNSKQKIVVDRNPLTMVNLVTAVFCFFYRKYLYPFSQAKKFPRYQKASTVLWDQSPLRHMHTGKMSNKLTVQTHTIQFIMSC